METALRQLASREDGPFVVRLAREPGRRDSRYAQLFTGEFEGAASESESVQAPASAALSIPAPAIAASSAHSTTRLDRLEEEVRALRAELDALKKQLGA